MTSDTQMNDSLIRKPIAWLPPAISLFILAMVLVHFARFGIVHEADEGTEAHLFQILMPFQLLVIAAFALKWLPRTPKPALKILVLHAVAALLALASVFFLT